MPDFLFELFSEEIPARMQMLALLPSLRARSAWRGGVGGGGCMPQNTQRAVDTRVPRAFRRDANDVLENMAGVLLTIDAAVNADRPPTPDLESELRSPRTPPQAGGGE
jgi:hypothetical protein